MTKLNIETTGMTETQALSLADFLISLNETGGVMVQESADTITGEAPASITEEKPKATCNRSKKVEDAKEETPEVDQETVNKLEVVADEPEAEDDGLGEESFPPATMEQINQQIQQKKGNHKDVIKAEFPKYGINAVRELKPEQYGAFYAFLKALK